MRQVFFAALLFILQMKANSQFMFGEPEVLDEPSIDSLMSYVEVLSSDEFAGRLPGSKGYEKAADFVAQKFKQFGLKNFPNMPDYKQMVPIEYNEITGPCDFHVKHYKKGDIFYKQGVDYSLRGFTGGGEHLLEVVFCGFGIEHNSYNDYENIDVKGKAMIVFKGTPNIEGVKLDHIVMSDKIKTAIAKGAKAIMFVNINDIYHRNLPIGSVACGSKTEYKNMPLIEIGNKVCEDLFEGTNTNVYQLYEEILKTGKPKSMVLKSKVYFNIGNKYYPEVHAPNVIGYIEGTAPGYKEEWVLLTAHLDHIGKQCDVIYYGANDNASGSALVIELARLLSKQKTKRGIIFALLTSEESGMDGSNYLAKNLPVDDYKIVSVLNFDCVAVGDSIQIGNGESNPILYSIVKQFDRDNIMINQTWKGGGADLSPFYELGIPGLYFVSKYSYTHLHLPTDRPSTFNQKLYQNIAYMGYNVALQIANAYYCREEVIKD